MLPLKVPLFGRSSTPNILAKDKKSFSITSIAVVAFPPISNENLSAPLIVIEAPFDKLHETVFEANFDEEIVNPSTS